MDDERKIQFCFKEDNMILKNKLFLLIAMLSLIPTNTKSAKENSPLVSMAPPSPYSEILTTDISGQDPELENLEKLA